ncbi:hypothetical protein [Kitasatospora sp. NPDC101183]|uniref:hypothetical protein n=1 Tax=Kitasatospora sp. NPDC101183 TaxID=3364100 RepID=UPI00380842D8
MSSAALLIALVACGPFGDDGPPRHRVALPEPAPASAQWIVDTVNREAKTPGKCPRPTLATLAVLDDDGHSRGLAFWLVDDVDVCWANLGNPWDQISYGPIGDLTGQVDLVSNGVLGPEQYVFTAFPGRHTSITVGGDTAHVPAPPALRAVDLGGGTFVTFVEFRLLTPTHGENLGVSLCPVSGSCQYLHARAGEFPGLPASAPAA